VTPLLKRIDDRYVIFGSGEEIAAEFDAANLPPLPAHWKRDYFFYANGFVKDMTGGTRHPLPWRNCRSINERVSVSGERKISRRCGCVGLPVELE